MIGIGPLELIVILIVALLVIGPEKMPEVARALAKVMRDLRVAMDEVREQFEEFTREDLIGKKEIENYYKETIDSVKKTIEAPEEMKKLDKDLKEVAKSVECEDVFGLEPPKEVQDAARELGDVGEEIKEAIQQDRQEEEHGRPVTPPAQPTP
jgi:Tat protein translocase TatB subunit